MRGSFSCRKRCQESSPDVPRGRDVTDAVADAMHEDAATSQTMRRWSEKRASEDHTASCAKEYRGGSQRAQVHLFLGSSPKEEGVTRKGLPGCEG